MVCIWKLAQEKALELGKKSLVMGILNITPDSFSDGGAYSTIQDAVNAANHMMESGADIIDVGAESTKPGAQTISGDEEISRLLPVVRALSELEHCIISVDTYRAETAKIAIQAGAHIINDISGLQYDDNMADVVAENRAGVVIMHTGRGRERDEDVIRDQKVFFSRSLEIAKQAEISHDNIVLDPGFGFAKTYDENVDLMKRAGELQELGYPLLAGTSRKRFIGALSGQECAAERDVATSATSVVLRLAGYAIFRVHNVAVNRQALAIADAVYNGDS